MTSAEWLLVEDENTLHLTLTELECHCFFFLEGFGNKPFKAVRLGVLSAFKNLIGNVISVGKWTIIKKTAFQEFLIFFSSHLPAWIIVNQSEHFELI